MRRQQHWLAALDAAKILTDKRHEATQDTSNRPSWLVVQKKFHESAAQWLFDDR
jgi:hypothetical protein